MYLFIIKPKIYIFLFKDSACNAGDWDLILGLGRSPGGGNTNPFHSSCLENPMKKKSLAGHSPWGHKESDMTEQLKRFL